MDPVSQQLVAYIGSTINGVFSFAAPGLQLFAVGMLGAAATVMEALLGVAVAHILHLQVLNASDVPLEPLRRPCDDITARLRGRQRHFPPPLQVSRHLDLGLSTTIKATSNLKKAQTAAKSLGGAPHPPSPPVTLEHSSI